MDFCCDKMKENCAATTRPIAPVVQMWTAVALRSGSCPHCRSSLSTELRDMLDAAIGGPPNDRDWAEIKLRVMKAGLDLCRKIIPVIEAEEEVVNRLDEKEKG